MHASCGGDGGGGVCGGGSAPCVVPLHGRSSGGGPWYMSWGASHSAAQQSGQPSHGLHMWARRSGGGGSASPPSSHPAHPSHPACAKAKAAAAGGGTNVLEEKLRSSEAEVARLLVAAEQNESEIKQGSQDRLLVERLEKESSRNQDKVIALNTEIEGRNNEISRLTEQLAKANSKQVNSANTNSQKLLELTTELGQAKKKIEQLEKEITENAGLDKSNDEARINQFKVIIERKESEIKVKTAQIDQLRRELDESHADFEKSAAARGTPVDDTIIVDLRKRLREAEQKTSDLKAKQITNEGALTQAESKIADISAKFTVCILRSNFQRFMQNSFNF